MDPVLSWVVALAVIVVVVSCCVMYAIRQVVSLTERVNKSTQAVSQLEEMQKEIRTLSDLSKEQAKRLAEESAKRDRDNAERLEREGKDDNHQVMVRIENLEQGLLQHELKVEDAVSRAVAAESKAGGAGGGNLRSLLMSGGAGDIFDGDGGIGRGALDLSVADFAALMRASESLNSKQSAGGGGAAGGGLVGGAYVPSPQFRGLLENPTSLRDPARSYSPSGGLFARPPQQQQQQQGATAVNAAAVAKNQYLKGNAHNPNGSAVSGIALPPSFWVYQKGGAQDSGTSHFSASGASAGALRRRLHSVSFIAGESMSDPASLVLKFAASEVVSAAAMATAAAAAAAAGSAGGIADKGVSADGAGPGVLAIPAPSITLVEVTLAPRDVHDSFAQLTGGSAVLAIRIEHRGVLGEWSNARQSVRDVEMTDRAAAAHGGSGGAGGDFSPNRPPAAQLGRPWTRQRALERASNVSSCSARGSASTAVTFYVPAAPSAAAALRHWVEYVHATLRNVLAIDDTAVMVVGGGGGMAPSAAAQQQQQQQLGLSHEHFSML